MKNLIYLLAILFLFACGKNENITIERCWKIGDLGEGDIQIYYPCGDQRIQLSRFSQTYEFYPNNKCRYLVLSPNDAHYFKDGKYMYDRKRATLTIKSLDDDLVAKFRILAIQEDQLNLKIIEGYYSSF